MKHITILTSAWLLLFSAISLASTPPIPESVADIAHIHHPVEHHFTGGQPTEAQIHALAELGVTAVINLRSINGMREIPEATWTTSRLMSYYHIPIASTADINPESVALFDQLMTKLDTEALYIHCGSSNRVGAMVALRAYWHQELNVEAAVQLGRFYGLASLEQHVRAQIAEHQ
ncbi:MAG: hypothetical protein JJU10_10895 [Idiomarina sp.]|nr:hypothetical protein [Idiomarina sp.]